jgi:anti-anti-sigma factor
MDALPGEAMPRPTSFEVIRTAAGEAVIRVDGDLDVVAAPKLRTILLERLAGEEPTRTVVDLSRCSFLDSAGIGVLVVASRLLGARFLLRGVSGRPYRALELVGLTSLIPIDANTGKHHA